MHKCIENCTLTQQMAEYNYSVHDTDIEFMFYEFGSEFICKWMGEKERERDRKGEKSEWSSDRGMNRILVLLAMNFSGPTLSHHSLYCLCVGKIPVTNVVIFQCIKIALFVIFCCGFVLPSSTLSQTIFFSDVLCRLQLFNVPLRSLKKSFATLISIALYNVCFEGFFFTGPSLC